MDSVVCGAEAILNSVQKYSEHRYNITIVITIEDQAIMYFLDNPWQQLQNGCMSKDFWGMTSATHFSELDFAGLGFAHAHYDITQPDIHTL